MTSSNAAPTDEGRAAVAASPPAAATSPSAGPLPDGDPPGVAATAASISDAEANSTSAALAIARLLPTNNEPETAHRQTPPTDNSDQPPPDQLSNEANTDIPIPSPPTVSPLSTPAATNINVDDTLPDDAMAKLTADLPPLSLARDALSFRSDIFGPPHPGNLKSLSAPEGMELDEPFMPDQANYQLHSQVQAIATTDPDPHGPDYSSHGLLSGMRLSQGSIDPSAYIMNIAAQATLFQDQAPSSIHPSAVSLHSFTQDSDVHTGSAEPASTNGSQKLESFARIEFEDSIFQMTTYAVIIGRDKKAMEQARADERREAAYRRKCESNERNGLPPPTPIKFDRSKFSKSYVSEEGGMLGPEHSDIEDIEPSRRRRPSSAVQSAAGEENASGNHVQSNRQYVSHTPGAAAVDLGALQTSPNHMPFIGIHSPGPDIASKTRGISRQHLKIQFNKKKGVFEGIALHKNGFFCEDVLYGLDQPATLRSGDRLQIKDVEFTFVINGVQVGMSGGEDEDTTSSKRMSVGGKEMSLDFEHSDHENFRDTSEELSDIEIVTTPIIESEPRGEEPEPAPPPVAAPVPVPAAEIGPREEPEAQLEVTGAQSISTEEQLLSQLIKPELDMLGELPPEFAMPEIPKRRGPGRPPKDGIMSKRERRLLKKQMQETSKKTLPQDPQEEKIKRPVGRPRKNPLPEDGERAEKRKYKKREDGREGSDIEKRTKEKKDKKVRPKSPPLDLRREDYTEDQLQKPTKNYGVLIDEALTNGPPDGLTLKQIYKRITARYPWFFFSAETKGWESSVRHNLIGNEAFKKDEETGLWSRVPGVELDAGKKRKAASPDRHLGPSHLHSHLSHSSYYQNSPYTNPGTVAYAHGLPSYSSEQKHPQPSYTPTVQTAQPQTTPSQPATQPAYAAHVPAPAQLPPGYGNLTLSRPSNPPQQSTYSSPYARPPPPNPPVKAEPNPPNRQTSTASSTAQTIAPAQQNQSRPTIASTSPKQQLSPEIERAIVQFSANMLNVISKQTPHAASIIEAAANRVRGLPVQNRVPGFDSVETTLINAMHGMIRDMRIKHHHTTSASPAPSVPVQASSTPSPAPPNTAEAEIQRRLRNFRESMVTALKTKTDKAEIIVDSAINRARGLPHAGKIPGWEEADNLMVKSVTQIIAEARSAHSQKLQHASPTPANTARTTASQPTQSGPRTNLSTSPASARTFTTSGVPHAPASNPMPAGPHTATVLQSTTNIPNSNSPSVARSNMPLQRPAPVALNRPPTMTPVSRTPNYPKDSTVTPTMASATTPAAPRPNVSSPAPPSAGVLDQITGHKRFNDEAYHKNHSINSSTTTTSHIGSGTVASNNSSVSVGRVSSSPAVNTTPSATPMNNPPSNIASNIAMNSAIKAANNGASNSTSNGSGRLASSLTSSVSSTTASNPTSSESNKIPSIPTSSVSAGAAGNPTTSAASNVSNIPTSGGPSGPANIAKTQTSNAPVNLTGTPTSGATIRISSIPSGSVPAGVARNPTNIAATSVSSVPASSGPTNVTRMPTTSSSTNPTNPPTSSAPVNIGSTSTSCTANLTASSTASPAASSGARHVPSSLATNHASVISSANNITCTKTNTASGATPSIAANRITGGTTENPGINSSANNLRADMANHTTAITKDGAAGSTSAATPAAASSVALGLTSGGAPSMNRNVPTSTNISQASSDHVSGAVTAQINNKSGESHPSKAANDKYIPTTVTAMEAHEPATLKAPGPIHNMSSPAPPSAGVVDQIAGHKRSLDEGPGSAHAEQPELKRVGVSLT